MISRRSVAEQWTDIEDGELRILIVGAGIAGVTLAQLLRTQGRHPVLIERSATPDRMIGHDAAGYMLALLPLIDPVIDELGIRDAYRERSVVIDDYAFHSHRGDVLSGGDIGALLSAYGEYRGIARGDLIEVLTTAETPVAFGTTVTAIREDEDVCVDLVTDGVEPAAWTFDLVVIADGLQSRTRDLVDAGDVERFETGWGGWVVWADADDLPGTGTEVWGDGFFLGAYPVKDRLGIFLGGPEEIREGRVARFARKVRGRLTSLSPRLDASLRAVEDAADPYWWPLHDVRSSRWTTGATVLLGDAAAGFLPTAGVGAGMAMESAWVLSETLRTADRTSLPTDLARFEEIARPRVEQAQGNSRSLARLMFRSSTLFAALRSQIVRRLSLRLALRPIIGLLEHRLERPQSSSSTSSSH